MPTPLLLLLGCFLLAAPWQASGARTSDLTLESSDRDGENQTGKPKKKQKNKGGKKKKKQKGPKAGGGEEEYYEVAPEKLLPPPLLPRVSLAQVSSHKRDVAGIRQQASNLGRFPSSVASTVASVSEKVDFQRLARDLKATEPEPRMCDCDKTPQERRGLLPHQLTGCRLPCGRMATTLSQSVSLVALHSCHERKEAELESGSVPFVLLDVALQGDKDKVHSIRLERGELGLAIEVLEGGPLFRAATSKQIRTEDLLVASAGPSRLAALKITVPKEHEELEPSPIYRPSWYINQLKKFYRYAIDDSEVLQGELALSHLLGMCDEDLNKGEVTIEFTWRTELSKDLQKLGFSLLDLSEVTAVPGAGTAALSQFQSAAQAVAAALERSTLAIDPGEALALGARPRATGNRIRELFQDYESKRSTALDWFDRVLAVVKLVQNNSETALGPWDTTRKSRELLPLNLALWTPSQLHVLKQVKDEVYAMEFRLGALSDTLENAVHRATRFLQPGQPPVEVEDCDLAAVLGGPATGRSEEEIAEFQRAFVRLDLEQLQAADLPKVVASLQAAEEGSVAEERSVAKLNEEQVQQSLQDLRKRFPYSPLIDLASRAAAKGNKDKALWAQRWAQIKDALDLSLWPRDTAEAPMAKPKICESEWMADGEVAKFPELNIPLFGKVGGKAVMHTFMVFANESTGCEDLLVDLHELHARLTPRTAPRFEASKPVDKDAWELYSRKLAMAGELGCQGMVSWAQVARLKKLLSEHVRMLESLEVNIVYNLTRSRHVELSLGSQTENKRKSKIKGRTKVKRGIQKAIVDWVMHCISKYASRSGGFLWEGVRTSLTRTKPRIDPYDLSDAYWLQLQDLEPPIISPFSDALCHRDQQPGEEVPCDDWVPSIGSDYWQHAEVTGSSLDHVLEGVELMQKAADPGAWRYLAQTAVTYAAVGFDAPGVLDNAEWTCERTIATCDVHPTCGRLAAQMLAFPWQGTKKYASDKMEKVTTWLSGKGTFDADGYHSYCHSSGTGYCWSYTHCLEEMLKWLCRQPETSRHCCPSPQVHQACLDDVNGDDCAVCVAAPAEEEAPELPRLAPEPVPQETLQWLHPSEEDEKMMEAELDKERSAGKCQVCSELHALKKPEQKTDAIWWMLVELTDSCIEHILFCGEMCGLYDAAKDDGKFKKPEELEDCEGWTARCAEKCPDV